MTLRAFRIIKANRVRTAFYGEGAKRIGGRWNLRGTAVVYASASAGLAALEVLVHTEVHEILTEFRIIPCEFPREFVEVLSEHQLPAGWRRDPAPPELALLGEEWVRSGRSCVLQVPSALVPLECNYLLNPQHADFKRITIGAPQEFRFDSRLRNQARG